MDALLVGVGISSGLAMTVAGLSALAILRRKVGPGPGAWAGALAWSGAVTLKVAVAVASSRRLEAWLQARGGGWVVPGEAAYNGLLTGVLEVGLVGLLAWRGRLGRVDEAGAIRFGVGFGAGEAVFMGLSVAAVTGLAGLAPGALPPGVVEQVVRQLQHGSGGPGDLLWPALERGSAMAFHLLAVLLVVAGRRSGRPWLGFGAAFLLKGLVDAAAAWFALAWGPGFPPGPLAGFELGLSVVAAASLRLLAPPLRRALARYPGDQEDRPRGEFALASGGHA